MSSPSRRARRLATSLALVGALALPAGAAAQTSSVPAPSSSGGQGLSSIPPVSLGSSKSKSKPKTPAPKKSTTTRTQLPKTGYDVVQVGLLGVVLVLLGVGLRLRTRDVRWG